MKKYFIILIIAIITISFIITHNNKNNNVSEEDKELKRLGNINDISYFKKDRLNRYIDYLDKNKNLSTKEVIKQVNMDLDKEPYKDMVPAKNLNKTNILVNKHNYLSSNYIPDNLRDIDSKYSRSGMRMVDEAASHFEDMAGSAQSEGYRIIAMSTYRSYEYQVNLYDRYVEEDGREEADTYSGRPGCSEHQTGLAVDVYNGVTPYTSFESTKEFNWMMDNSYKYGFILRFPKDKENETGYQYESWHYRYVGLEVASFIHKKNISFEEYIATN